LAAAGPVFVSSSLHQSPSTVRYCIGGTRAVCDGLLHRWEDTGTVPVDTFTPGAADVEATLMELRPAGGLPLPAFHAVQRHDITLVDGCAGGCLPVTGRRPAAGSAEHRPGPAVTHTVTLVPWSLSATRCCSPPSRAPEIGR